MTQVDRLAHFVVARSWDDLSERARAELKIRVLDTLGCALGALDAAPVRAIGARLAFSHSICSGCAEGYLPPPARSRPPGASRSPTVRPRRRSTGGANRRSRPAYRPATTKPRPAGLRHSGARSGAGRAGRSCR